jgi:hypothetical protein
MTQDTPDIGGYMVRVLTAPMEGGSPREGYILITVTDAQKAIAAIKAILLPGERVDRAEPVPRNGIPKVMGTNEIRPYPFPHV